VGRVGVGRIGFETGAETGDGSREVGRGEAVDSLVIACLGQSAGVYAGG
jgi:hypothetical protein